MISLPYVRRLERPRHNAIDYTESWHGDFHTIVATVGGLIDYAVELEEGTPSGASGAYHRAVAKGIREAVEDDDLLSAS